MKFEFKGQRQFIYGRWYNPGDIIEVNDNPNKSLFVEIKKKKEVEKNVMES